MTILRVVDIETTGMEPPAAEVIELGWWDVEHHGDDGASLSADHGSGLFASERPCPPEVMAVHHISEMARRGSPLYSRSLVMEWMGHPPEDTVGVAHNADYERRFVGDLFGRWICTYKVALRVWPEAPSHGNQALMYWRGLERDMEDRRRQPPHRALPDAYVTAWILLDLVAQSGLSVDEMVRISAEPRLLPTCPIGKFRGKPWSEVDHGFLDWMLRQPDMEADLKWLARRELDRRRTERMAGRN